jgi:hypothetical protein
MYRASLCTIIQYALSPDASPSASKEDTAWAQQIVGTLHYNGRAIDPTLTVALSTTVSHLSTTTSNTITALNHFLNYFSTHPEAIIRYCNSDMQLKIHRDVSCLSDPKATSLIGGYVYLRNKKCNKSPPLTNGRCYSSVAESELGAIFINAKDDTVTRTTLTDMGHPQQETELKTDNSTADGIVNKTVQQKHLIAMNMRF